MSTLNHHSIEAEQAVLGGLMIDNSVWDHVADVIDDNDFYRLNHRIIFRGIVSLIEEAQPCDVVTLSEWLFEHNELDNVGGHAYVGGLAKNTPTAANIKAYAGIVRERALLRQLRRIGTEIVELADSTDPLKDKIDRAQGLVMSLDTCNISQGPKLTGKLLPNLIDDIERRFNAGGALTGLSTGLSDLDAKLSGLQPSDLIIIAARPSIGKTTLAMNFAENIDEATIIFSLEMSASQLLMRSVASLGRVPHNKIRDGKLDEPDWSGITRGTANLKMKNLIIDDTPALSIQQIRSRARKAKREYGIELVIVDYLQLIQAEGERHDLKIGAVSSGLKALAKELNIPVVCLSQLNRDLERRENKRPHLSDLRESGAIEQDADVIVFIYRDEVYNENSSHKGIAELIIAKHRNGETGKVHATFQGEYCRFDNFTGELPVVDKNPRRTTGFKYSRSTA